MVGRKLAMLQSGQITYRADGEETESFLKAQYVEELKHSAIRMVKRYGYLGLVAIIRSYFRLSNLLKNKYQEIKTKIENIRLKNSSHNISREKKEVSKFLKMISEYKYKIRELKHKIKEEEESL